VYITLYVLIGITVTKHLELNTYFVFFSELGLVLTTFSLICVVLHYERLLHLVANNCVELRSNKVKKNSIHQLVRSILHMF